jgi:hypothetical protein
MLYNCFRYFNGKKVIRKDFLRKLTAFCGNRLKKLLLLYTRV